MALYFSNKENKKEVRIKENVFQTLVSLIGEGKTTASSFLVYSALKRHDIVGVHSVFPSFDTLVEETNLSKGTISNTIKSLIDNGVILAFKLKIGMRTMIKYYFPLEYDFTTEEGKTEFLSIVNKDINDATIDVLLDYINKYIKSAKYVEKKEKLDKNIGKIELLEKLSNALEIESETLPF